MHAADATAQDVITACEALQDGLPHRRADVLDAALGGRLAPELTARGWTIEPQVVMACRRAPTHPPDPQAAEQAHPALLVQTERATARELLPEADEALIDELARARDRLRAAAASRAFVGFRQNAPAAHATLLMRGAVAQVADVATASWARGHGLAGACVLAAVDDARRDGTDLVFLHIPRDGRPRALADRLGFDVVGAFWTCTRGSAGRRRPRP